MNMLNKSDLDSITYVIIEIELSRQSADKIMGAFIGYRPLVAENTAIASKDEMFLWLAKGEQIHLVSLDHYKITEIRLGTGVGSCRILTTNFWDMHTTIAELSAIRDALISRGWADETGLIDSHKYSNMSKALQEEVDGAPKSTSYTPHTRSNAYVDTSSTLKKKEVNTTTIKRTSKYDAIAAIEAMNQKIKSIKEGKYEPPKLSAIPIDKNDKEEKKIAEKKDMYSAVEIDGTEQSESEKEEVYPYMD